MHALPLHSLLSRNHFLENIQQFTEFHKSDIQEIEFLREDLEEPEEPGSFDCTSLVKSIVCCDITHKVLTPRQSQIISGTSHKSKCRVQINLHSHIPKLSCSFLVSTLKWLPGC